MRKIAGFIVKRRSIMLIATLVAFVVCGILTLRVEINSDMTKYLPDDSSMKQGIDVMNEEFPDLEDNYTIRIMFTGLDGEAKKAILAELESIPYVDKVDYEADGEDYNKDDHTLYVINSLYDFDTEEMSAIEIAFSERFSNYDMVYKLDKTPGTGLTAWIITSAFGLTLIILFAMCASWLEPFLFFIAIGAAIVINMGTNIFLGSISFVTASISSVLQLALSMDYSIMLINRYRQELEHCNDKYTAMTNALTGALVAISSSSMTTIAGLLALVFMSFKIGKDLGFVLAKGIFFCLLCIFTLLPALILMCDRGIKKTAKKTLHINMNAISGFSYRFRYFIAGAFVILFFGAYTLQSHTQITYTMNEPDPIAEVFPVVNSVVVLFDNNDERNITEIAEHMADNDYVKNVVSFSTTVGKSYTSAELADELRGMDDSDFNPDPQILDILYYYYYMNGETGVVTTGDFLNFIIDDVVNNDTFSRYIDDEITDNLDILSVFADKEALNVPRSGPEIASLFKMDKDDIANLMVYYYGKYSEIETGTMTLPEFVGFIRSNVLTDEDFSDLLDEETLDMMDTLITVTDEYELVKPKTAREISADLDIDPDDIEMLMMIYQARHGAADNLELTFPQFTALLIGEMLADSRFDDAIDEEIRSDADKLAIFADPKRFREAQSSAELAGALGMEPDQAELLYTFYFGQHGAADNLELTFPQFANLLTDEALTDSRFDGAFDDDTRKDIDKMDVLADAWWFQTAKRYEEVTDALGMDPGQAELLYMFYFAGQGAMEQKTMDVSDFVFLLLNDVLHDSRFADRFDWETRMQMEIFNIFGVKENFMSAYSSKNFADLFGADAGMADLLYAFYTAAQSGVDPGGMTITEFVRFLMEDIAGNSALSSIFGPGQFAQISALAAITDGVVLYGRYNSAEMSYLLGGMGLSLAPEDIETIYSAAGDNANGFTMTVGDFIDFLVYVQGGTAPGELLALQSLIRAVLYQQTLTAGEMASLTGMDAGMSASLYLYYMSRYSGFVLPDAVLYDLVNFIVNGLKSSGFDGGGLSQLPVMLDLMNAILGGKEYFPKDMARLTGMETDITRLFYAYHSALCGETEGWLLSLHDLVDFVLDDLAMGEFSDSLEQEDLDDLEMARILMQGALSGRRFTAAELAAIVDMKPDTLRVLYAYYISLYGDTSGWLLPLQGLVDFVLDDLATGEFSETLDQDDLKDLEMARTLMQSAMTGRRFTAAEFADVLDMKSNMINAIYAYYINLYGDTWGWLLPLQGLVDYILTDLAADEDFGDLLDDKTIGDLQTLKKIIAGTLEKISYNPEDLAELLETDPDMPKLLYLLRISRYGDVSDWRLPIRTFINFINDDILTDEDLAGNINTDDADKLKAAKRLTDATVAGTSFSNAEMADMLDGLSKDMTPNQMKLLYVYYFGRIASDPGWTFSIIDLFNYLVNDILNDSVFSGVFEENERQTLTDAKKDLDKAIKQLSGSHYSIMFISTTFPGDSDDINMFIYHLIQEFDSKLKGKYYLIGTSPMHYEMAQTFGAENSFISILTAIAVFIVVALVFRSLSIPAILVLVIQCGVFISVSIITLQGYRIYYLALLIVQCILMGATIDYGILFVSYYIENRKKAGLKEALAAAYNGSIHTILTSGLILFIVVGVIGTFFENPVNGQICQTISRGALCAMTMVIFILPGILAACDRWITGNL